MRAFQLLLGLLFLFVPSIGNAAYPRQWQMFYQEPVTPIMDYLYDFHHFLLIVEGIIVALVAGLLIFVIIRFRARKNPEPSPRAHNTLLEMVWTIIPLVIVLVIAVPSFKLLWMMDVTPKSQLTIKAIGNQWYWTYEYPDHNIRFDSNMLTDNQLKPGQFRLLEVDHRLIVPIHTTIRIITTSSDVVHSWAIPAFGVKRDSIPGRLNETWFNVRKPGVYYGQCSELCGVKHGFMPIVVEAVTKDQFNKWLAQKKGAPQTHRGG